jgi:hypothetical protein
VGDPDRAREVSQEDRARLERRDQQGLAVVVVGADEAAELLDAGSDLLSREIDLPDRVPGCYEASFS